MTFDNNLKRLACEHVKDQGKTSETGHVSTKGVDFPDRVKSLQEVGRVLGENIVYGTSSPKEALLDLVIDDGLPGRGHRENVFKEDYSKMGSCFGKHAGFYSMFTVIY